MQSHCGRFGDSMEDVYQTQRVTPLARSSAHEISKNMATVRPWEEGFDGNSWLTEERWKHWKRHGGDEDWRGLSVCWTSEFSRESLQPWTNSCVLASTSELAETPPEKEQDNSTWVWNISGVLSVLTYFQNYSSLRSTCDTWSIFCQGNISNINININIHESSGLGQNTARLAESPVIPWFVPQTRVWTGQRVAVPPSFTRQFVQIFSYFLSTGSTVPSVIICMIVVYQFIMHLRHELLLQPVLAAEHKTNQLTVKACKGGVRSALSDSFFDRRSLQDTARFQPTYCRWWDRVGDGLQGELPEFGLFCKGLLARQTWW